MFTLSPATLRKIGPNISVARSEEFAPLLTRTMQRWGIDTYDEVTGFLANLLHESGEFRWMAELWGPTAQQLKYERDFTQPWPENRKGYRNWLPTVLGNADKGDGHRYMGRGPIQVTGKHNYIVMMMLLDLDLVDRPDLLLVPQNGFDAAGAFWWNNKLDDKAKKGFVDVVKAINGGTTGLEDRKKYLARAHSHIARF